MQIKFLRSQQPDTRHGVTSLERIWCGYWREEERRSWHNSLLPPWYKASIWNAKSSQPLKFFSFCLVYKRHQLLLAAICSSCFICEPAKLAPLCLLLFSMLWVQLLYGHAVGPCLIWRFSFWRCSFPVTLTHGCWFVKTFFSSFLTTWLRARKYVGIEVNTTCFIKLQVLISPAVNSLFSLTLGCIVWWGKLLAARKILLAMI
jgi:hypothetical protein